MRGVCGAAAAVALVLGAVVASECAGSEQRGPDGPRFLLFSTTDLWRHGGFVHGGVLWSPEGVDNEGFALKVMFGGGRYRYISGALGGTDVDGRLLGGAILPGWRLKQDKLIVTVFGGLDLQNHKLTPDDPAAGLRGSYAGLRVGFEVWYEPTPYTMLAADASVSTIGTSYNARAAFGWRAFERYYLGPEVHGFATGDNYHQLRAGVHVTGLRTAMVEWSAGLGWAIDNDERDGIYGKLGVLLRH